MVVTVTVTICQLHRSMQPQQAVRRTFTWANLRGDQASFEMGLDAADEKIGIPMFRVSAGVDEATGLGHLETRIEYAREQYAQLIALAQSKGFVLV